MLDNITSTHVFRRNFYAEQRFSKAEYITLTTLNFVIAIFGCMGNVVVIIMFFKYATLRTVYCIYLITYLAVADLVNCIGNLSYSITTGWMILYSSYYYFNRVECIGFGVVCLLGLMMSQIMTFSIALDRMLAFRKLAYYKLKNHRQYALRWFIFSVAFSLPLTMTAFVRLDSSMPTPPICNIGGSVTSAIVIFFFTTFATVMAVAVFVTYSYGLYLMLKRIKSRPATVASREDTLNKQIRATKTVSLVLVVFLTLWVIPNALLILSDRLGTSRSQFHRVSLYVGHAANLCSAINPYIYAFKHKEIKMHLCKLLRLTNNGTASQQNSVNGH